jgi:hypothetical protein
MKLSVCVLAQLEAKWVSKPRSAQMLQARRPSALVEETILEWPYVARILF